MKRGHRSTWCQLSGWNPWRCRSTEVESSTSGTGATRRVRSFFFNGCTPSRTVFLLAVWRYEMQLTQVFYDVEISCSQSSTESTIGTVSRFKFGGLQVNRISFRICIGRISCKTNILPVRKNWNRSWWHGSISKLILGAVHMTCISWRVGTSLVHFSGRGYLIGRIEPFDRMGHWITLSWVVAIHVTRRVEALNPIG